MENNQNNVNEGVGSFLTGIVAAIGGLGAAILSFFSKLFDKIFSNAEKYKFDNKLTTDKNWEKTNDIISALAINSNDAEIKAAAIAIKEVYKVIGGVGTLAYEQDSKELKELWTDAVNNFMTVLIYNIPNSEGDNGEKTEQPTEQDIAPEEEKKEQNEFNYKEYLKTLKDEDTFDFESVDLDTKNVLSKVGVDSKEKMEQFVKMLKTQRELLALENNIDLLHIVNMIFEEENTEAPTTEPKPSTDNSNKFDIKKFLTSLNDKQIEKLKAAFEKFNTEQEYPNKSFLKQSKEMASSGEKYEISKLDDDTKNLLKTEFNVNTDEELAAFLTYLNGLDDNLEYNFEDKEKEGEKAEENKEKETQDNNDKQ